ncbi:disulfide bond formation protein B [Variovorax sp. JS1663]|uniref:disulfide bond formation protein B n=1 Tax=Variovorax sp. JS1663 TaxID=1851577 RepID=UPI000B347B6E
MRLRRTCLARRGPAVSGIAVQPAATLGSLFFTEVMQLQPCVLCWYQRIARHQRRAHLGRWRRGVGHA